MKTTLLLIFTLFIATYVSAQNHRFADSSAQWNVVWHRYGWFPTPPDKYDTYIYRVKGDTVINNQAYQHISCSNLASPYYVQDFIRRDTLNRIYLLRDTQELKLYDFGANVGDTVLNVRVGYGTECDCVVDSVDAVNIGGLKQRQYVHCYGTGTGYADEWVDGIGSLYFNPITNYVWAVGVDFDEEIIACYYEDSLLSYSNHHFTSTCYITTFVGINDVETIKYSLSPNPSNGNFAIILSEQPKPNTLFIVYDALGTIVKRVSLTSGTQQISITDFPNGLYTYIIGQDNLKQACGKLVIAK